MYDNMREVNFKLPNIFMRIRTVLHLQQPKITLYYRNLTTHSAVYISSFYIWLQ